MTFNPTLDQAEFLESADWFFNGPRGSGRSTVAALVAIRKAMQGRRVYLFDPSVVFEHGDSFRVHQFFAEHVIRVAREYFPDHEFEVDNMTRILTYAGPSYLRLQEGL